MLQTSQILQARQTSRFIIICAIFFLAVYVLQSSDESKGDKSPPDSFTLPDTPPVGIGFNLTTSYSTAVLSLPNGSAINVAKIEANTSYKEAIKRLSLVSSKLLTPPSNDQGEYNEDKSRRDRRRLRRSQGLQASKDVAAIADLVKSLLYATAEYLGHGIDAAVVTMPNLVALYDEDMMDISENLHGELHYLPYWHTLIKETGAAYFGYGLGLCKNYTNVLECNRDQHAMPLEYVMAVSFTEQALTLTLSTIKSIMWLSELDYVRREFVYLENDAMQRTHCPHERHLEFVHQTLSEFMVSRPYYEWPGKVLVMGECADDKGFRTVLENALVTEPVPKIFNEDPEYIAAKGAAEMAKRAPYIPTWRCHFKIDDFGIQDDYKAEPLKERYRDRKSENLPDPIFQAPLKGFTSEDL